MLRLLPHDDDDDSRDDLIFEISMEFSRKLLFLLLSRFQKEQCCFTNHTNTTINKALFFFFQKVKHSLLLAGERAAAKEYTQRATKKLLRVMKERKKERRDQKQKSKTKKSEKKAEKFCTKKETKFKCMCLIQIIERKRIEKKHDDYDDADDSYPAIPERQFRHLFFLLEEEH